MINHSYAIAMQNMAYENRNLTLLASAANGRAAAGACAENGQKAARDDIGNTPN
jgi:hypothetical protein